MNYIQEMRKRIGHNMLFTLGCGAIIERDGRILLQHRTDEDNWCIPGGVMEVGEQFEETVKREVLEETGLELSTLYLFGIYSGEKCFVQYPNKDQVYSVQIIFNTSEFKGDLKQIGEESKEHRFFQKSEIPQNLNPRQESFILDWVKGEATPIID